MSSLSFHQLQVHILYDLLFTPKSSEHLFIDRFPLSFDSNISISTYLLRSNFLLAMGGTYGLFPFV